MSLEPIYDSVEAVPEPLRPFFKEENGKHVIDLAIGNHPNFIALRENKETILGEKKAIQAKYAPFAERFPNGLTDLESHLESLKSTTRKQGDDEFNARVKPLQDGWSKKEGEFQGAIQAYEKEIHGYKVRLPISEGLVKHRIDENYHSDVQTLALSSIRKNDDGVYQAYDAEGKPRYDKNGNPMGPHAWLEDWVAKHPSALIPSTGSGVAPGAGTRPAGPGDSTKLSPTDKIRQGLSTRS